MRKPIGLVGGMSPFSTSEYYLDIVRMHEAEFGDASYPRILIASVSFQEVVDLQHKGDWDALANLLQTEFSTLESAGAEVVGLCTNTMHRLLPKIRCKAKVLTVYDAVGKEAHRLKISRIGLTGTRFTMNDESYRSSLEDRGLEVFTPDTADQETIHRIIYDELVKGMVSEEASSEFGNVLGRLFEKGADAVLLGCTELRLLHLPGEVAVRTIDTANIHARAIWGAACVLE